MIILGIETSCDETATAIVKDGKVVISNTIASSADLHAKTGGVIPEDAARQQIRSIIPVIKESLQTANIKYPKKEIDLIAVTYGPGLIGSLLVGVETAKTLSYLWDKPIVPVNHLLAHIYANWLEQKAIPEFPAIALVVSGGHTDMVLMKGHGEVEWIGGTRDDAAGEAFDKSARLLGLPYPGGPQISKHASDFIEANPDVGLSYFPRPIIDEDNFDFSFSGLKTAVLNEVKDKKITESYVDKISAEVQEAIVDVLVTKTERAVRKYNPKSLLVAGGVSANNRLRSSLTDMIEKYDTKLFIPELKHCTDNATYIATYAYYNNLPLTLEKITATPSLSITNQK
jgi:N6-L-threonylcarbamoyladenine synthase